MTAPKVVLTAGDRSSNSKLFQARQALKEFLGIPFAMLLGALLLGVGLYALDRNSPSWLLSLRDTVGRHLFRTSDATGAFLGVVGGGLFTQTSIVITMLLLVLQQTASVMGNFVYDQFLRRHRNQVYAGYVLGLLLLTMLLRTTVSDDHNPILGGLVVLILVFISLALLVWFLFSTIEQMRPETIVDTIHDKVQDVKEKEQALLRRFRAEPQLERLPQVTLQAKTQGYVGQIDFDAIETCLEDYSHRDTEIIFRVRTGDYIAYRAPLADIKAGSPEAAEELAQCVGHALRFLRERTMDQDASYGIKQLESIAWTEISTAKDNFETGLMIVHTLRSLIARWAAKETEETDNTDRLPVVYTYDLQLDVIDALESLAIVSSESMQHQVFSEVIHALASVYRWLPEYLKRRADKLLQRAVSAMGDHVLTQDIDDALSELIDALRDEAHYETAQMVQKARSELAASLGKLSNRSTRVKQANNSG